MTYPEAFANDGPAYTVTADYTPQQLVEIERLRRNRAKKAEAVLKAVLAELPDDMPVAVIDSEWGAERPTPRVVDDNHDIAGLVLELGGWA